MSCHAAAKQQIQAFVILSLFFLLVGFFVAMR
jgi:hypothetical protein